MAPDDEDLTPAEKIPIYVVVEDGVVTAVFNGDVQVRAVVQDYDVEFPYEPANALLQDEEGKYYIEKVV